MMRRGILLGVALVLAACGGSGGKKNRDKAPPTITIETPTTADTYLADVTPIDVGGTAADDAGVAEVTWSNAATGGTGTAAGTDTWTASIPLVVGDNAITVTARDAVARTSSDSITITLDLSAPVVVITTPTTAATFGTFTTPADLAGTASDDLGLATVEWYNPRTGGSGSTSGTTSWTAQVALVQGMNPITITATDLVGKTGTDSITVSLGLGELYTWGSNSDGQLGDGVAPIRTEPAQVVDPPGFLTGAVSIAAGGHHTLATLTDTTARGWGWNTLYQLGDGSTTDSSVPVPVASLTSAIDVAAGWYFSVAVLSDGTVRAWGANFDGQLGDGTTATRQAPVQVIDPLDPTGFLTNVIDVEAGGGHTVALKGDGTVWAWGYNYHGQVGDGTTTDTPTPTQVVDPLDPSGYLQGAIAIGARGYHTVAALGDGTARGWGRNWDGQCGDGTSTDQLTPVQVRDPGDPSGNLTNVADITAGTAHSVAAKGDGTVWAWGANQDGQLGDGTTTDSFYPVQALVVSGIDAVVAGYEYTLALRNDDTLWAWGDNAYGQLGDGTTTTRPSAVQVVDPPGFLANVDRIAAGWYHSAALLLDGTIRVWGRDYAGAAGTGDPHNRTEPVRVVDTSDPSGLLTRVTAADPGWYHCVALRDDGTLRTWGWNVDGQLGNGTLGSMGEAVQVTDPLDPTGFLTRVVGIAAGRGHTGALIDDGTIRMWGYNTYGQIGNGTRTPSLVPIQVGDPMQPTPFDRVTSITGGIFHSAALRDDGTVWTWGDCRYGQLGIGVQATQITPQQVIDGAGYLTGVSAIAAGGYHTVALMDDGTLRAWGANWDGRLGDGTSGDRAAPVQVVDPLDPTGYLTDIVAIAPGDSHTLALKSDGTVRGWGSNTSYQLGDPSTLPNTLTPIQVTDPLDPSGYLTAVVSIAAGQYHSATVKGDGTVWTWGRGAEGQLGAGPVTTSQVPIQVIHTADPSGYLTGVVGVGAGAYHTLALK